MLTDAALRADREAKLAAAIAHLGDKYVLAKPITRTTMAKARQALASVAVDQVEPLLDLISHAVVELPDENAVVFVEQLNRVGRAVREAKAEAAR